MSAVASSSDGRRRSPSAIRIGFSPVKIPVRTKAVRATSVSVTMATLAVFERRTPPATTTVSTATPPTARGTASSGFHPKATITYPANPRAAVAAEAVLARRKSQPAANPADGDR
jgi:hypothetical protein